MLGDATADCAMRLMSPVRDLRVRAALGAKSFTALPSLLVRVSTAELLSGTSMFKLLASFPATASAAEIALGAAFSIPAARPPMKSGIQLW